MNPTLQSQFDAAKSKLVNDLSGLIRKAAEEAVQFALSTVTLGQPEAPPQSIKIHANAEGKFEAEVDGRLVKRSRRRDLVRYARNKGFSAA